MSRKRWDATDIPSGAGGGPCGPPNCTSSPGRTCGSAGSGSRGGGGACGVVSGIPASAKSSGSLPSCCSANGSSSSSRIGLRYCVWGNGILRRAVALAEHCRRTHTGTGARMKWNNRLGSVLTDDGARWAVHDASATVELTGLLLHWPSASGRRAHSALDSTRDLTDLVQCRAPGSGACGGWRTIPAKL